MHRLILKIKRSQIFKLFSYLLTCTCCIRCRHIIMNFHTTSGGNERSPLGYSIKSHRELLRVVKRENGSQTRVASRNLYQSFIADVNAVHIKADPIAKHENMKVYGNGLMFAWRLTRTNQGTRVKFIRFHATFSPLTSKWFAQLFEPLREPHECDVYSAS